MMPRPVSLWLWALLALGGSASAQQVIELETIAIIGNRELPRTLAIVPWKEAEPMPLPAPESRSILDQPPQPIGADELRRRVDLFQAGFVID